MSDAKPALPLLNYNSDVAFNVTRKAQTVEEQEQFFTALGTSFATLFRGSPRGFYLRHDDGSYHAVHREITIEDWLSHLLNMPDCGLVIVPVTADGRCFFAAIDLDRHGESDAAVDWAQLARRVTELNLPLVVCQSGGGKGGHLFCFFRERENGIPASDAIRIMKHYAKLLDLPDGVEIFPKQTDLDTSKGLGNAINIPYRTSLDGERIRYTVAYDADGKPLEWYCDFLNFAWERSAYGGKIAHDLPGGESPALTVSHAATKPLKASEARRQYHANLDLLRAAPLDGNGNALLNKVAFHAGSVLKALDKDQDGIRQELLEIVCHEWKKPHPERGAETTIDSGLTDGMAEPRGIVFPPSLPWRDSSKQIFVEKSPAVIDRLIYAASSTALIAKPKIGKTTFALDASECVLYGRSFLKEDVVQGNVLYVSEQPLGSFVAEMQNSGLQTNGELIFHEQPKGVFHYLTAEDWYKFSWDQIVEGTVAYAIKLGAKLVCFDTLSRIARVEDENKASEMQAAVDLLVPFYEAGIAVLIVQHERKSGGDISDAGRGTGALAGSVDVLLRLTKSGGKFPGTYRTLEFIGRFPGPSEPRMIDRQTAGPGSRYELQGSAPAVRSVNAQESILAMFPEEDLSFTLTFPDILEETDLPRVTVQRALSKLVQDGILERTGTGKRGVPFQFNRKVQPF